MKTLKARTPIIPLSYSEKHKAQPKELLIDYNNGNIYVVSAEDKSIIFDITAKIYEQLENMSGDNIEITIEGIGPVKIKEILEQLQQGIDDTIQAIETGEEIVYVSKENVLDGKSLNVKNKKIELKGFSAAETHMIPRKGEDGSLEWINMPKLPDIGSTGSTDNSDSSPVDGEITEVHIIEPMNDKLYLRASKRQKSINLSRNCFVVLPRVLDAYSEINWYVRTNSFAPMLKFSNNIVWSDISNTQPQPDAHQMYKFISLDAGETWLGELVRYCKTPQEGVVYISYLQDNYYDIDHINANHYNKNEVDDRIKGINTVDPVDYYNKTEIDEGFYNKTQVDSMIDDIEAGQVDLSDYYNKTQINEGFYNKTQVDSIIDSTQVDLNDYYNKTEIDFIVNDIEAGVVDLSGYYNKTEVDNKISTIPIVDVDSLLSKDEAVQSYYNKTQIDTLIDETYQNAITNPVIPSDVIRQEQLATTHYNKIEVDSIVDSVIDLIPDDKNLSNYVTTTSLQEGYYDKVQVDDKIASVEAGAVDLTNYYTKQEIDDNFYDITEADEKFYDKDKINEYVQQLDDKHYDKDETEVMMSWKVEGVDLNPTK